MRPLAVSILSALICTFCAAAQTSVPPPALAPASSSAPQLSPSEAYRYAMQPFSDARSAPNDLTDADQWALGLGASRAKEQCDALSSSKPQGEELLAMGRLCVFGQDLEPARKVLLAYLALPKMDDAKTAHLLLARVFLTQGWTSSAEMQMDSLTSLFAYDADTHVGIDLVIDTAQAADNDENAGVILRLNDLQLPYILKALSDGGQLKGKDNLVDAARLVHDALRCATAMRDAGKDKEAAVLVDQITKLTTADAIAQTASKPSIDAEIARYEMVGKRNLLHELRGTEILNPETLRAGTARPVRVVPATLSLVGKTTILVAFSLGAPASRDAILKLQAELEHENPKPSVQLAAITSYAATNGEDTRNSAILDTLKAFRSTLPDSVSVLIVPDADLKQFSIDTFPMALVVNRAGNIAYLNLLTGTAGSIHSVVRVARD